ncbi:TlpA family protein disulfide reductase [Hazenella coriacea]|uniref:Peroxiredoxin n=1 Tax=Hazenella coriacea TaxID=1179467 RepID=A0A4R3L4X6_9BACL|nr:TlpA disulfide reductase family protein [Hazenella coriacea]TCS94831.1 peroxiredoxin [Hazenella coriacea]
MRKYRFVILAGLLVLLVLSFVYRQESQSNTPTIPEKGYQAPLFQLEDLNGKTYDLSSLKGKIVFINFWATWCPPCRAETPDLVQLHGKYKDQVVFLGINATKVDDPDQVQKFVEQYKVNYPVLLDPSGKVVNQYRVHSYPTSYIIDSQGVIVYKKTGVIPPSEFEKMIEPLIKK